MGWKAIRDALDFKGIIQVRDGAILLGTPYVADIIVIRSDATLEFPHKQSLGWPNDGQWLATQDALERLPLADTMAAPDTFTASIPVYTYDDAEIITKLCETPEWPNVTHDGKLMHDNTYSTDKATVIRWAIENALAGCRWRATAVSDREAALADARVNLGEAEDIAAKLEAEFPNEWHAGRPSPEEATND